MMRYVLGLSVLPATLFALQFVPQLTTVTYEEVGSAALRNFADTAEIEETVDLIDDRQVVEHVPLPEQVRAIYMSSCVVGTPSFRQKLVDFVETTEINSLVIDIKDYSGSIAFNPLSPEWKYAWEAAECGAWDMREFIELLHEKDIFVIGRVTVFQDPLYTRLHPEVAVKKSDGITVWKDHKGLSFVDVGSRDYWEHIALLAKDSYNMGFDEINFDYVRYPSDGPMLDISFPNSQAGEYGSDKQANLEAFFKYLHETLREEDYFAEYKHTNTGRASSTPYISADLFGMTTTNTDDLSIGQILERALPYMDFVAPMVYPSHYPNSFLGLGNPNDYPYKVVYHAMKSGVDRAQAPTTVVSGFAHTPHMVTTASGTPAWSGSYNKPVYPASKLRTWIQDFDYGGDYDAADVRAQIQASYDAGVMDYMVWAPSNIYTKPAYVGYDTSTSSQ